MIEQWQEAWGYINKGDYLVVYECYDCLPFLANFNGLTWVDSGDLTTLDNDLVLAYYSVCLFDAENVAKKAFEALQDSNEEAQKNSDSPEDMELEYKLNVGIL